MPYSSLPIETEHICSRRDGRVAEGARLESVYTGNRIVGSNPTPSATFGIKCLIYLGLLQFIFLPPPGIHLPFDY